MLALKWPVSRLRSQPVQIAITMVVAFTIAFGLMYRQRRAASPPPIGFTVDVRGSAPPLTPALMAAPAARPLPLPQLSERVGAVAADRTQQQWSRPMPVRILFAPGALSGDPASGPSEFGIIGRVVSESLKPLTIDIIVTSDKDGSTTHTGITVEPHQVTAFGLDDGLNIHQNDQITLRSARYADLVVRAH